MSKIFMSSNMGDQFWFIMSRHTLPELYKDLDALIKFIEIIQIVFFHEIKLTLHRCLDERYDLQSQLKVI